MESLALVPMITALMRFIGILVAAVALFILIRRIGHGAGLALVVPAICFVPFALLPLTLFGFIDRTETELLFGFSSLFLPSAFLWIAIKRWPLSFLNSGEVFK